MQPLFDPLPVVDFHRVFLKYENGHAVLKNIQFSLEKGSFLNQRDLLAAQNIKKFAFKQNNTARTAEIYAVESMNPARGAATETCTASCR